VSAPRPRRRRVSSRTLLRLGVESALIVASVLLGFALNEWEQRRLERERADAALANFRREIEQNLATLRRVHPIHEKLRTDLEGALARENPGKSAFDVFREEMPESGLNLVPLRDAAWETAVSTGALRLLDYETAALLSETYLVQRGSLDGAIQRFVDRFYLPDSFEPAAQKRMLRTHQMMLGEVTGLESYLLEVYPQALEKLPRPGE